MAISCHPHRVPSHRGLVITCHTHLSKILSLKMQACSSVDFFFLQMQENGLGQTRFARRRIMEKGASLAFSHSGLKYVCLFSLCLFFWHLLHVYRKITKTFHLQKFVPGFAHLVPGSVVRFQYLSQVQKRTYKQKADQLGTCQDF